MRARLPQLATHSQWNQRTTVDGQYIVFRERTAKAVQNIYCLSGGHGFSRAEQRRKLRGFNP
jgi:hypothetical protein